MKGVIAPRPLKKPPPPKIPSGARILAVDDDPDIRALLRRQLEHAGYRVDTAEDAVAAAHAMERNVPDLIVVDFLMPYMNGVDFVDALRSDAALRGIPAIFITSMSNVSDLVGRTFGRPLLIKPVSVDELLSAVESQLRARAA